MCLLQSTWHLLDQSSLMATPGCIWNFSVNSHLKICQRTIETSVEFLLVVFCRKGKYLQCMCQITTSIANYTPSSTHFKSLKRLYRISYHLRISCHFKFPVWLMGQNRRELQMEPEDVGCLSVSSISYFTTTKPGKCFYNIFNRTRTPVCSHLSIVTIRMKHEDGEESGSRFPPNIYLFWSEMLSDLGVCIFVFILTQQ